MAHPTKLYKNKEGIIDPPSLYDISGSAHFYNKADYGLVVHRNRQMKNVMIKVEKVKFRHLGESGKAYFCYNGINGRYLPWEANKTPAWDDSNYLSAIRKKQAMQSATQSILFQDFFASPAAHPAGYTGLPD